MAAAVQALRAPSVVCSETAPRVCTSSKRHASPACSASAMASPERCVRHTRVAFNASSFLSGSCSVHLASLKTPSRCRGEDTSTGSAARAAALFQFLGLGQKMGDKAKLKFELQAEIALLSRGASATEEDCERVDEIARELEKLNPTKDPLKSSLLNGKWKLIYTTSESILKKSRPAFLRPSGPIFQAINLDTLRAQNLETWPYFNQVTANLQPVSGSKVIVLFDFFKIAGLISVKAPGRARGELEITYLDDELRISRGDRDNLFVLEMEDPDYRVPV
ncbi:unnamed protein product [Calypogeia fissa]